MTKQLDERALAAAYLEELHQPVEIAVMMGVSRRTVERRIQKLGLQRNLSARPFPERPLRRLYIDEERSATSIAQIYKVDLEELARRILELGLPLREKYMDEEWLREMYEVRGLTTYEIAEQLGATNKLISDWLGRFGISTAKMPLYQDREWLYDQYVIQEKSIREIARELGVSYGPIQEWLHRHGIPISGETYSGYKSHENAPYRDHDWLLQKRFVERKSEAAIADECGASRSTINRWLRRLGFDQVARSEAMALRHARAEAPYKEKEWLQREYETNKRSSYNIAAELGVSPSTIRCWLLRHDIEIRDGDESYFLTHRNELEISPRLMELLEGELLGDGCIVPAGLRTAVYGHGTKHREYVVWLAEEFAREGLLQSGRIRRVVNFPDEEHSSVTYVYRSRSYEGLMELRSRFYPLPQGKKIVPPDLALTPIVVRQWYIGDGQIHGPPRQRASITLHTCAFDRTSIGRLMTSLAEVGFQVTHQAARNTIHISAHSTEDFLEYIGVCPGAIQCVYGYKWDTGT